MRKGLFISLTLHAAILFYAIAVFPSASNLDRPENQPIPVELVTPAEISKVKAGQKEAEKEVAAVETPPEKPQPPAKNEQKAPPPKKASTPPPPAPDADAEPAPKPLEKAAPKPTPRPEPKPEPVKTAEKAVSAPMPSRKPKPPSVSKPLHAETRVAAKTPPKKKPDFNPDQIAALLDKRPDAGPEPPTPELKPDQVLEPPKPAQGHAQGRDQQMTLSEIDALRARISQCWNPPVGGLGSEAIRVKLRLQLNQDGMLAERPQVVNREGSPFFTAAADSAVRAVMLCQPYSLPSSKYALWRDMILNFDPREMFGG